MDIVYVCRPGDNEELRYSIRSVVKNIPHNNLWLVGNKPKWYSGKFLSVPDKSSRYENIRNAIESVSINSDISEDFLLMNDDFFILKPLTGIPVFHGGLLIDKINNHISLTGTNSYVRMLNNTHRFLLKYGIKDPLDYDIHVPMKMNKTNLSKIIHKKHFPRSMYGNIFNIGGTEIKDVKIYPSTSNLYPKSYSIDSSTTYLSTLDSSFEGVFGLLQDMFRDKAEYEL
jgi:hypothetical protein